MKQTSMSESNRAQALRDRFGRAFAARLSQGLADTSHEVSERLRVARFQAVERHRLADRARVLMRASSIMRANAVATLGGDEERGRGSRWIAALPIVALAAGLLLINAVQSDNRDTELAEVDAALLTDDLPPAAYADPGFMQFLKSSRESGGR